jgi:hypothetical protein
MYLLVLMLIFYTQISDITSISIRCIRHYMGGFGSSAAKAYKQCGYWDHIKLIFLAHDRQGMPCI